MQKKQFENEQGIFYYEIKDGRATITGFEGLTSRIKLPSQIEEAPVAAIDRKAFLSQKTLYGITLPDTVEEIGDWAFAYCDNLTEISLPGKSIRFGRAVFKNCGKLERIMVRVDNRNCSMIPMDKHREDCSVIPMDRHREDCSVIPMDKHKGNCSVDVHRGNCSMVPEGMHGETCFTDSVTESISTVFPTQFFSVKDDSIGEFSKLYPGEGRRPGELREGREGQREKAEQEEHRSGEAKNYAPELLAAAVTLLDAYYLLDLPAAGSREWLGKWDTKLLSVLRTADQEGYISQSVYGEEDYIGTDLEEYVSARRKEKVRLAFLRLLYPKALQPALKEELEECLRSLTKGCQGEEAWQVLREEHGDDREYYSLFAEIHCVTAENLDGLLADIGEECPEMKAYFLTMGKAGEDEDFFAGLEL